MNITASHFTPNAKPFTPMTSKVPAQASAPAPAPTPAPVVEPVKPRDPTPPPRDVTVDQFARWTHTERETNDFKGII